MSENIRLPIKLRKKLKLDLKKIRRAYSRALRNDNVSIIDEWLCDNYYILEREGMSVLKELRASEKMRCDKIGIPYAYYQCKDICKDGKLPTSEKLTEILNSKHLNSIELENLPTMLKSALLVCAADVCSGNDERSADILSNSIKSIRNIQDIDFDLLVDEVSEVERILKKDPSGVYPGMDDATRAYYRKAIVKMSLSEKIDERNVAENIVKQAKEENKHIGEYINVNKMHKKRGTLFLILEITLPLIISSAVSYILNVWYVLPLLCFVIWELIRPVIELLSLKGIAPCFVPRMDLDGEIPDEFPTLVTVSSLLPSGTAGVNKAAEKMEQLYRTNSKGNIKICMLADLKGAKTPTKPEDNTDIASMQRAIKKLNEKHGNVFILLIRPRSYSKTEKEYTGWERKRGAITQLIRLIKGKKSEIVCVEGNGKFLNTVKYIMALDSDTSLSLESVSEILATAVHPLNKAEVDVSTGTVKSGYGIFVPRVETDLKSAGATAFSKIMAGDGGITAYDNFSSDRYQDLFGEGIFSGKGLIDVDAFYEVLNDKFCDERVLSHDILEGSFLRTKFVSDVQVTDGFPKAQTAYLDRLHRWVRGDWQNIGFTCGKVRLKSGKEKNPLNGCSRYKLFDNLRRSITPVLTVALIIISTFMNKESSWILSLIAILSVCSGNLISMIGSLISGGPSMFSRKYYSGAMPVARACFIRAVVSVVMLVQTAFICFDAIVKALYRMAISKRHLLQWVTAAESEKSHKTKVVIKKCLPSIIVGAYLVITLNWFFIVLGAIFISDVFFALFSSKESEQDNKRFDYLTRDRLNSYAAAMWRYYDEFCTQSNNYLPPDNVQETPVYRVAYRTSPTNIGLMLLCTLAARDLGFIDSELLCKRLKKSFESIRKLEKWNGNLINWYDIKALKAMEPKYVSTVDSGNFICSLITLKQGLKEYISECTELKDIIAEIETILSGSDISKLYNKRRKLFYIGYDMASETFSDSYYDLLMSESRMTSYYAIANGDVSKKHWGALGRTLARAGRYTGPVSWTGTMFEYFMPHLLLPAYDGTLNFEALQFCLWCQKKRVQGKNVPWGISESGFYAFDPQLNYQYKAHGVQKLGLKRGLDSDCVIAPYATFLALPFTTKSALKNLKELEEMQMTGRCGFYEAADFTAERVDMQDYAVVRSYMAHHVGMSMISVCNALKNNIMQKRFISDEKMASATSLLEEKIPSGAVVFKDVELREVPQRAERVTPQTIEYSDINPINPHMHLLTNGEWSTAVTDLGASASVYRGVNITSVSKDLLRRPSGIFAYIKVNDTVIPLTKALDYNNKSEFSAEFSHTCVELSGKNKSIEGIMSVKVHPRLPCEQRTITVKNNRKQSCKCSVNIYFEPSLTSYRKEKSHPAFSKLFISGSFDEVNNLCIFERKASRDDDNLCIAVGFLENVNYNLETSKEKVLKNPKGISSFTETEITGSNEKGIPDNCCAISVPLKISSKGQESITLMICAASTKEEAIERALKARIDGRIEDADGAPSPFNEGKLDGVIASAVLPKIFFYGIPDKKIKEAVEQNDLSKKIIWKFGISGDNPIILININNEEDMSRIIPYVRLNRKLYRSGIMTDVAVTFREGGEYNMPVKSALNKMLRKEKCLQCLNVDGGIHAIDISLFSGEEYNALVAASAYIASSSGERFEIPQKSYLPLQINPSIPIDIKKEKTLEIDGGYFSDNCFVTENKTVNVPWCHVLSNSEFGTLISDNALGYTWAINSRENKLTPWYNDISTDNRGELLLLRINGKVYDMIYGSTAAFYSGYAEYFGKADSLYFKVRIEVPERGMKKDISVEIYNASESDTKFEIAYYTEPVLGVDTDTSRFIKSEFDGKNIIMTSPWNDSVKGFMSIGEKNRTDFYTCNRESFLQGDWYNTETDKGENPCACVGRIISLQPKTNESVQFFMTFAVKKSALYKLEKCESECDDKFTSIKINTPDKALDCFVNGLLLSQIINSRILGRTGFYQCGGAYGYRDQLQDILSIIITDRDMAKRHIIRCASYQFEEGDVLHWWHRLPGSDEGVKGVRTRYSDDMLWLVYAVCEYIEKTGEYDLLDINVSFLKGEELSENEIERYFSPERTEYKKSVFEHCKRAIERSLKLGEHGLPLIGGGDWNDGYNTVGINGTGESVWLGQFLAIILEKMSHICETIGEHERQNSYAAIAKELKNNIDNCAWDGNWYLRAFYDDGTKMGSHESTECCIDSLTQSFSALADMPDKERVNTALGNAVNNLADRENGLVRLFTPPFSKIKDAGYVSEYPAGIRENGGQYTHASVWLASALLKSGRTDNGYEILKILNPVEKYLNGKGKTYGCEPYALCGDVSSADGIEGKGGWSLYTGAAGWYYKTVYEDLLGIKMRDNKVYIEPNIPDNWDGYTAQIKTKNETINVTAKRTEDKEVMLVDNKEIKFISLDNKDHNIICYFK